MDFLSFVKYKNKMCEDNGCACLLCPLGKVIEEIYGPATCSGYIMKHPNDALKIVESYAKDGEILAWIEDILFKSVSDEYIHRLMNHIGKDVLEDVKLTSAYSEDGHCNDDDVRLSIGRVLLRKFGEEV